MISGLRKNHGPITPELLTFDKTINPIFQSTRRIDPISADLLVKDDMLDHVRTVPKAGKPIVYTGPKVDQFGGLSHEDYLGAISTTIRRNQKITGLSSNIVGYGENLRREVRHQLDKKLFRDHQSVLSTYCINPTLKKSTGDGPSARLKKRMLYLLHDNDYSMGIRKDATDERVLSVIEENIKILYSTMIEYRKDAKMEYKMENLLRDKMQVLNSTIREISKDASKELKIKLREKMDVLLEIEREFKDRKVQYRAVKLRNEKTRSVNSAMALFNKDAHKDAPLPMKDPSYVDSNVLQSADQYIPRPGYSM